MRHEPWVERLQNARSRFVNRASRGCGDGARDRDGARAQRGVPGLDTPVLRDRTNDRKRKRQSEKEPDVAPENAALAWRAVDVLLHVPSLPPSATEACHPFSPRVRSKWQSRSQQSQQSQSRLRLRLRLLSRVAARAGLCECSACARELELRAGGVSDADEQSEASSPCSTASGSRRATDLGPDRSSAEVDGELETASESESESDTSDDDVLERQLYEQLDAHATTASWLKHAWALDPVRGCTRLDVSAWLNAVDEAFGCTSNAASTSLCFGEREGVDVRSALTRGTVLHGVQRGALVSFAFGPKVVLRLLPVHAACSNTQDSSASVCVRAPAPASASASASSVSDAAQVCGGVVPFQACVPSCTAACACFGASTCVTVRVDAVACDTQVPAGACAGASAGASAVRMTAEALRYAVWGAEERRARERVCKGVEGVGVAEFASRALMTQARLGALGALDACARSTRTTTKSTSTSTSTSETAALRVQLALLWDLVGWSEGPRACVGPSLLPVCARNADALSEDAMRARRARERSAVRRIPGAPALV